MGRAFVGCLRLLLGALRGVHRPFHARLGEVRGSDAVAVQANPGFPCAPGGRPEGPKREREPRTGCGPAVTREEETPGGPVDRFPGGWQRTAGLLPGLCSAPFGAAFWAVPADGGRLRWRGRPGLVHAARAPRRPATALAWAGNELPAESLGRCILKFQKKKKSLPLAC